MTVETLWLSGLPVGEAEQAAKSALDIRTGPADLRRLLVVDNTDLLLEHAPVFERLVRARRVENLLCVAVGPRPGPDRTLRVPGNLGGTQGYGVLWVSDPDGIDWRVAASATAVGHGGSASGLDRLVELLQVEEVFDRVHELYMTQVPGRIASPGLRLAGADDESAAFAAALAVAIRRLTEPGDGTDGPFTALLAPQAEQATLDEHGRLARFREEVEEAVGAASAALGRLTGLSGRFRRGDGGVHEHLREAGQALADLRNLVAQLLQDANSAGEPSENQRRLLTASGIRLPAVPAAPADGANETAAAETPVSRAIAEAIRGGDPLPLVTRRITATEREVKRRGSASYLPEVEQRCPSPLLGLLADPGPGRPLSWRSTADARRELGLDDADRAANALVVLVLTVANREWSPATTASDELARVRIALEGARKTLTEYASAANTAGSGMRGARLNRIGEMLRPVLCDLVVRALAGESATPSVSGQEAFEKARKRTADLLAEWGRQVQADGISAQPSFATFSVRDVQIYSGEDDVAEVREALLQQPDQQMWQLCAPDDLGALDVSTPPPAVWFAPRLNKGVLAGAVPADQMVWTSSGSYAGLLRLVSLRPGLASSEWGTSPASASPAVRAPSPVRESS